MLEIARSNLGRDVSLRRGGAEDLVRIFERCSADIVLFGNCIHLVADIPDALSKAATVLRPGGTIAINTAFFDGADAAADRSIYWALVLEGRRQAKRLGSTSRGAASRPLAKRQLTRDDLRCLVEEAGFRVRQVFDQRVQLNADVVRSIVSSAVFSEGALPGYPHHVAQQAMSRSCDVVLSREPDRRITRTWHYLVGERLQ